MTLADNAVWLATQGITGAFGRINKVSSSGLDEICKGSVVGMKHTKSPEDFLLARCLFPRNAKILATRRAFVPGASYLLKAAGFVPLTNPLTSESRVPDYRALREFYSIVKAGGIVVYAPEAACFQNRVAEKIFPEFVIKAGELKLKAFIMGVNYENGKIQVKAEQYDPAGKPKEVVVEEMRERLARLSGLELEIGQPVSAAGNYR